jgi:hypothetical protein
VCRDEREFKPREVLFTSPNSRLYTHLRLFESLAFV